VTRETGSIICSCAKYPTPLPMWEERMQCGLVGNVNLSFGVENWP